MLRKPLIGKALENVLAHGTGALNIDATRVASDDCKSLQMQRQNSDRVTWKDECGFAADHVRPTYNSAGRWPANVTHDGSDEVLEAFPTQSSVTGKRSERSRAADVDGTNWLATNHKSIEYTDTGSPSRFYYCAKSSKTERNGSNHPTVKPISLMRYLCRLVTPPNGTVLDPFAGTGSTGQAAIEEGFRAILIEREADYCATIRCRLALWLPQPMSDPAGSPHQSPFEPSSGASPDNSPDTSSPPHGNGR